MREASTLHDRRPVSDIDEKDQRIIEYLIANSSASVELLAEKVALPPSTVQKRLSRLFQESYLERAIRIVDWAAVGYPLNYWVDMKVNLRSLQAGQGGLVGDRGRVDSPKRLANYILNVLSADYKGSLIVQDVIILLGSPADLSVALRAKDHHAVLDFVTVGLRSLGAVDSTTTFHAAWSRAEGDLGIDAEWPRRG